MYVLYYFITDRPLLRTILSDSFGPFRSLSGPFGTSRDFSDPLCVAASLHRRRQLLPSSCVLSLSLFLFLFLILVVVVVVVVVAPNASRERASKMRERCCTASVIASSHPHTRHTRHTHDTHTHPAPPAISFALRKFSTIFRLGQKSGPDRLLCRSVRAPLSWPFFDAILTRTCPCTNCTKHTHTHTRHPTHASHDSARPTNFGEKNTGLDPVLTS
jgi:hypothetical protein